MSIQALSRFSLAVILTAVPFTAHAELSDLDQHLMLGVDRDTGELKKFSFFENDPEVIGTIKTQDGDAMLGIEAAAYFPGFSNVYALWQDPTDELNKLVFVRATTAEATVMFDDVEGGRFTGATAYHVEDGPYTVYTIQHEKVKPPAVITGLININPNNSNDNLFVLETLNNGTMTRTDLHEQADIAADGTLYEGIATEVRVKPKGNGNQNTVSLDGVPMSLKNSNTYSFAGEMTVRVYNDKPKGGKAMGQWWIEIVDGTALLNDEVEVLSPHRLAIVSVLDGSVTEVMTLSRGYYGLATKDGVTFYAHADGVAYQINTAALTETPLSEISNGSSASDMEFVAGELQVYETGYGTLSLIPVGEDSPAFGQRNVGLGDLGAIMFYGRGFGPISSLYD